MTSPLWLCPRCGRSFANRNQTHACAPLGDLDAHFAGSDAVVRECFDRIIVELEPLGPVEILAEKTRIALHVRMSFAAIEPHKHWLDGHLVLARHAQHPSIRRIQEYSRRNIVHEFRLAGPGDIDTAFVALLQAYEVGCQRHRRG